jgi:hypothetical protein
LTGVGWNLDTIGKTTFIDVAHAAPMTFRDRYRLTIEFILGDAASFPGLPEERLAAAERRIGLRLPVALRDYLLFAGGEHRLNTAQDRLCSPEKLGLDGSVLPFYFENQGVVLWGIPVHRFGEDDPPVVEAENNPAKHWEPFADRTSDFLVMMLYWQAANGGLPITANGWASRGLASRIHASWSKLFQHRQLRVYGAPGLVLCIAGDGTEGMLHAGARSDKEHQAIVDVLGDVDWDYNSRRDEA